MKYYIFFILFSFLFCNSSQLDGNLATSLHLQWLQKALSVWDIGLVNNLRANSISTQDINIWIKGELRANNFIEVVDSFGSNESSSVVGKCILEYISESPSNPHFLIGAIFKTNLKIKKSFLLDTTTKDEFKIAAFAHEIGHCLGLRHPDDDSFGSIENCSGGTNASTCIMNSTLSNIRLLPAKEEIIAIKGAYNPVKEPILEINRFDKVGTYILRQRQQPQFYIDNKIANGSTAALLISNVENINKIVLESKTYILYDRGSELIIP